MIPVSGSIAAPVQFAPPMYPGKVDRAECGVRTLARERRRREDRAVAVSLQDLDRLSVWGEVDQIVGGEALTIKRGRLGRERLGGRGALARHVPRRARRAPRSARSESPVSRSKT